MAQAVLHKNILAKDINTQKIHGKNLIGNKYCLFINRAFKPILKNGTEEII